MDNLIEPFWRGGPRPGSFYKFPGNDVSNANKDDIRKRTLQPIVTGTSVLGLKFDGGVMIAADMLGSYGSLARFRDVERIMKVNETTILSSTGDFADYQYIKSAIQEMVIEEEALDDGFQMGPHTVFSWMTRVLYSRRSKFDPLWATVVVGGYENGESFLGCVDKIGIGFTEESVATGYGAYIAQPLLRKALEDNKGKLSAARARQLIEDCLKVLYYRDARSYNRYQIAVATKDGVVIEKPKAGETDWSIAHYVRGFE